MTRHVPCPLSYDYVKTPLEGTVELAMRNNEAPLYIVHFSQDAALSTAQSLANFGIATKEQREQIKEMARGHALHHRLWQDPPSAC